MDLIFQDLCWFSGADYNTPTFFLFLTPTFFFNLGQPLYSAMAKPNHTKLWKNINQRMTWIFLAFYILVKLHGIFRRPRSVATEILIKINKHAYDFPYILPLT